MRRAATLLLVVFAVAGFAQDDAASLLKRSLNRNARYTGVRTVDFRRGPDPSSHQEYVMRDGSRLRIEFPKGSPMEGQIIVENGEERRHFFPELNEIHILPPRREEAFDRLNKFLTERSRFRINFGGDQSVAGRTARQLVVADPRGNVVQKIFVDRETGVILKRDLFDPVGSRVGGFEFSEFRANPNIDRRLFKLNRKGARIMTPRDLMEQTAKREGFRPLSLPEKNGVKLEWSGVRDFDRQGVFIQGYVSPFGRLTLFQLRQIVSQDRLRGFARDKVKFVFWRREGRTFVLVGETDGETLRRLASPISLGTPVIGP